MSGFKNQLTFFLTKFTFSVISLLESAFVTFLRVSNLSSEAFSLKPKFILQLAFCSENTLARNNQLRNLLPLHFFGILIVPPRNSQKHFIYHQHARLFEIALSVRQKSLSHPFFIMIGTHFLHVNIDNKHFGRVYLSIFRTVYGNKIGFPFSFTLRVRLPRSSIPFQSSSPSSIVTSLDRTLARGSADSPLYNCIPRYLDNLYKFENLF